MKPARRWLKRIAPAAEESAPAPQAETEALAVEAMLPEASVVEGEYSVVLKE
jgi:hypothetical protein